jgi:hypothetical protein
VAEQPDGTFVGVEAVVDKDLASGLLAHDLGADLLLIPTGIPRVAINFGKPEQKWLDTITVQQARAYIAAGEFGAGSMEPKIAAIVDFLESTPGAVGAIGIPEELAGIIAGRAGTRIVGRIASAPGRKPDPERMPSEVLLAVNGTLMRGLQLNANMMEAGATFVRETTTEPIFRLWTINDVHPAMIRVTDGSGAAIQVELWSVPDAGLARILLREPLGLTIGKVKLADGTDVLAVLGEPALVEGHTEITAFGGWRRYMNSKSKA